MMRFTDLDELNIEIPRGKIFDTAITLMLNHITADAFTEKFAVKVNDGDTIFTALINSGGASNQFEAAVKIGKAFPPGENSSWNDLAKWVAEYSAHDDRRHI